ncbi:hypothetical protein ACLQ3C_12050 [Gordonia sp. DT30]|uniref:hypothetical protein n=1 Tax=unclassified Gordonia (in: high G+C Gram-positive bacteria) TaxID=2657482 RepID=UPI003CF6187B
MSVETIPNSRPEFLVSYSNEDEEWVATSPSFPSLSWLADTPNDAVEGLAQLIGDVLTDLRKEAVEQTRDRRVF